MSPQPRPTLLVLGGSSFYMLLFFEALQAAGLWPRLGRLVLFGRDRRRLDWLAGVARIEGASAAACEVLASTDIGACAALQPDWVFNQIRFGGLTQRDLDERLALAHGLVADETLGIVGVSNALRTLQGLRPLVDALATQAPAARWINFTNPCSLVTQFLSERLGSDRVIGLCDYPEVFRRRIATFLDQPLARLEMDYWGLNHMAFVHGLRAQGQDLLPVLLARAAAFEPSLPAQAQHPVLLVPSWAQVFHHRAVLVRQTAARNRAGLLLDLERECEALLDAGERNPAAHRAVLTRRHCDWYALAVAPLLRAGLGSHGAEAVINLDAGSPLGSADRPCVVETQAWVDGNGARPLRQPPAALRELPVWRLCAQAKTAEWALLDALQQQDGRAVLDAAAAHPMVQAPAAVRPYFRQLAAADPQVADFFAGVAV